MLTNANSWIVFGLAFDTDEDASTGTTAVCSDVSTDIWSWFCGFDRLGVVLEEEWIEPLSLFEERGTGLEVRRHPL